VIGNQRFERVSLQFAAGGLFVASAVPLALAMGILGVPLLAIVPTAFFLAGAVAGGSLESSFPGAIWRFGVSTACMGILNLLVTRDWQDASRELSVETMIRLALAFAIIFTGGAVCVVTLRNDDGNRRATLIILAFLLGGLIATVTSLVILALDAEMPRLVVAIGFAIGYWTVGVVLARKEGG
jgi:hypothetical protein